MKEKLFMMLLGCKPKARLTEQHDIYFAVAQILPYLVTEISDFWPEMEGIIHIDVWREVNYVDGHQINVVLKDTPIAENEKDLKLFFLNLGGYKENDFEEYHYKMIVVAQNKGEAIQQAKQTAFYKHTGIEGAPSHIDNKYGIDIDDMYDIEDILSSKVKEYFRIQILPCETDLKDILHTGPLKLSTLNE